MSGLGSLESGIRNPDSGIRNPESVIRNQESGIRKQESGIENRESEIVSEIDSQDGRMFLVKNSGIFFCPNGNDRMSNLFFEVGTGIYFQRFVRYFLLKHISSSM